MTLPSKDISPTVLLKRVYSRVLKIYPFLNQQELQQFEQDAQGIFLRKAEILDKPVFMATQLLQLLNNKHAGIGEYQNKPSSKNLNPLFSSSINNGTIYVKIPHWYNDSNVSESLIKLFEENSDKYQKVIIDVRGNDGGNSIYAHEFAGIFFNKKCLFGNTVTKSENGQLESKPYYLKPNGKIYIDKPIAILIDNKCFSSNELFIAPFKVSKRAMLVGDKTAGGSGNPLTFIIKSVRKYYRIRIPRWRFSIKGKTEPIETTRIEPDIYYQGDDIVEYATHLLESKK